MDVIEISIDPEEVLVELELDDVIEYYGANSVLDEISATDIVAYYDPEDLMSEMDLDDIKEYIKNQG